MFGKKAREAQRTIESQREVLSQQENRIRDIQREVYELKKQLEDIRPERDKLKTKVRDQTEADLLMVSMKIIEEVKKGTKKEDPALVSLQQDQARLRAMGAQLAGWGSSPFGGVQAMMGRL